MHEDRDFGVSYSVEALIQIVQRIWTNIIWMYLQSTPYGRVHCY